MWLLSTDRAELHYFQNNYEATGGYAILSHTWSQDKSKPEQTHQDVQDIIKRCQKSGTNPLDHPKLSPKIRNCCIIAAKYGYRWVWIDSCCIDKKSSSELSEAINSMFRWYKESEVCFAYLADVSSDCELRKPGSAFRESRWHTRGWTLQELIAPDFLIFLSEDWHELGNRFYLAGLLWEITRIPIGILAGVDLPAGYSICDRMSWACQRKTTRVEDEAYCLMGLFGVSMPTNYGEGNKAFIRLQYKIMKNNPDFSLFVFSGQCAQQDHGFTFRLDEVPTYNRKYLLAVSPQEFTSGAAYLPYVGTDANQQYPPPPSDPELTGPFEGGVELPRVAVTSYGVELRVPVIEADGMTIAVILCQQNGRNIGLFLTRDNDGKDPKRPRYFTGCVYTKPDTGSATFAIRLADLGNDLYNLIFNGKTVKASWRTIHVVPTISDLDTWNLTTPMLMMNCNRASRFRIPRWLVSRFTALQFSVRQLRETEMLQILSIFLSGVARIYVSFGSCMQNEEGSPDKPPHLWANADVLWGFTNEETFTHNCSEDHLDSQSWMSRSKVFGDADRGVRLSLIPSTWMPDSPESFVIHLEPLGRVIGEWVKGPGGVSMFPSLTDLEKDGPRSGSKGSVASPSSHISSSQTTASSSSTPPETLRRSSTHAQAPYSLVPSPPHPPTASLGPPSASTSSSNTPAQSSRSTRPVSISPPDTLARESTQHSSGGQHELEPRRKRRRKEELPSRLQTSSSLSTTGSRREPGSSGRKRSPSGSGGHSQTRRSGSRRLGAQRK